MIRPTQTGKALKAIHSLIIEVRFLIGNDSDKEYLYKLVDSIEYLPTLMLDPHRDLTAEFGLYLKEICNDENLFHIYNDYIR